MKKVIVPVSIFCVLTDCRQIPSPELTFQPSNIEKNEMKKNIDEKVQSSHFYEVEYDGWKNRFMQAY